MNRYQQEAAKKTTSVQFTKGGKTFEDSHNDLKMLKRDSANYYTEKTAKKFEMDL